MRGCWSQTKFAMSLKLKLFSLVVSNASPKFIGLCECVEGNTYAKLRPLLEVIHIVNWHFQFFDVNSICMINYELQGLNRVSSDVYVLPLVESNFESQNCMHKIHLILFLALKKI